MNDESTYDPTALGRAIRAARLAGGWSQNDMARRSRFQQQVWSEWECGRQTITLPNLAEAAVALETTAHDLLRQASDDVE